MHSTPLDSLPDPLQQILKTRPDWASGVASTGASRELKVLWVGAAIMNVLGLPVGWIALFGDQTMPVYFQVALPAFTLLGLHILFVAVRDSLRWRRFGRLQMTLDPLPGSIGGHVGGALELPFHQATAADFRVVLLCIRDRLVKTSDGSSRSDLVEWSSAMAPDVERSGTGVRLGYTFEAPEGLPQSEEPSDDYHKWVIRVQADVPGPDLDQVFEVPVLLMDPPLEAREPALSEATAADVPELSPRVVRVHRSRGGLTLSFPSGRGGLGGMMILIFGAVFAGAGVFAFLSTTEIGAGGLIGGVTLAFGGFFLLIFGGIGGLMMLLGIYSLVNSLVVEIGNGKVVACRSFFLPFRRTARFEEFEKIEMDVHSRVGQGAKSSAHVRIRGCVRGGRRISLGDDIPLGRQSEILAALLEETIGIPVKTVTRSRPEDTLMTKHRKLLSPLFVASIFAGLVVGLAVPARASATQGVTALVGARIWDGTGAAAISDGIMLVRDGRITYVGERGAVPVPAGATVVDLRGRTIIPGLINTHGHVGGTLGLGGGQYNRPNLMRQLRLYAEYGVTTVNSLGGDEQEGFDLRDEQAVVGLDRARIFVAGAVVAGSTVREALAQVQQNADMGVDWMKLRVDDNLGASQKMSPQIYSAIIDRSHELGLRLASHLFYLDDAKALMRAETDFIAHSVRDQSVDDEFLGMLAASGICYTPTLTREVSTYVYETRPDFFDDPFFLSHADPAVLEQLQEPARQARYARAQPYKQALQVALRNVKTISDAGLPVVMGTDTGPAARFQGYFEHMELDLMAEAGLTPEQILRASTGVAAECLRLDDEIGTLRPNRWADFIVLTENPLDDIRNVRSIESVWIGGEALR